MAYQTTEEQCLLLNNLLYCEYKGSDKGMLTFLDEKNEGGTIGEFVDRVLRNEGKIDDSMEYFDGMSGKEFKQILHAVKNDPTLSRMVVKDVHIDPTNGAGGKSAVLVDPATNEAVVAFKGTEGDAEWIDNFQSISGSDTDIQRSSLEWYQDTVKDAGYENITLIGHSKGANKAKYITLMDDSVDRCIAQDGQGFNDDFMTTYKDQIAKNQYKITNYNSDKDPVNILLNDVGETHYYKGENIEEGGLNNLLENHCPNTLLHFDENGNYSLTAETVQDPGMVELDKMLNSYIRTMPSNPPKARERLGELLGLLMTSDDPIAVLASEDYKDDIAGFMGYVMAYKEKYPQLMGDIERIMSECGMEEMVDIVKKFDEYSNAWWFDTVVKAASKLLESSLILEVVKRFSKDFYDLLKKYPGLLALLRAIIDKKNSSNPNRDNGHDIVISPSIWHPEGIIGPWFKSGNRFDINPEAISIVEGELAEWAAQMERYAHTLLTEIIPSLDFSTRLLLIASVKITGFKALRNAADIRKLYEALSSINRKYRYSEQLIMGNIGPGPAYVIMGPNGGGGGFR